MMYRLPNWALKYLGKEDLLTVQCANYMRLKNVIFHHTFNEAKRSRTNQVKVKGFGVMTGVPDFLIFESCKEYHGLSIELKVIYDNGTKNRLSNHQKEAQKTLSSKGWLCVTVWDFDQFIHVLDEYLKKD